MLVALGIHQPLEFISRYPQVKVVKYDGSRFPFKDKEFDVCWSNAVIDHVGNRDKQLFFLQEIKRVSRRAFITTPNRHFLIEVHTRTPLLHFLPKKVFEEYLNLRGKRWATGNNMHLLSIADLKEMLKQAGISNNAPKGPEFHGHARG